MGSYQSTYLGPYLEAHVRKESRPTDLYGCTNAKCGVYAQRRTYPPTRDDGPKFCSQCAAPWGKTTEVRPYLPLPSNVLQGRESLMWIEDYGNSSFFHFLTNVRPPGRPFHVPDREEVHVDFVSNRIDRDAEIAWFEKTFAEEIALLSAAYDVKICWGLHVYWS